MCETQQDSNQQNGRKRQFLLMFCVIQLKQKIDDWNQKSLEAYVFQGF